MPFMSDIKNEENEEGDSDNIMIKVQVCDVVTLKRPFLTGYWHVDTCAAQVVSYLNSWQEILAYCCTLKSSNQKQKLHTITKNVLQMCKSK